MSPPQSKGDKSCLLYSVSPLNRDPVDTGTPWQTCLLYSNSGKFKEVNFLPAAVWSLVSSEKEDVPTCRLDVSDSYGKRESRNPTSGADYDEISLIIGCLRSRDFLEQLTVTAVSAQLCRLHGIFHCIVVTQDSTDVCSNLKICFILVQNSTMVN